MFIAQLYQIGGFFFSVILQILLHMLTWMLDARQEKEQTWWPVFSQLINLLIIKLVKAGDYFFLSGSYRVLWKIHVLPYTKCMITVFWILVKKYFISFFSCKTVTKGFSHEKFLWPTSRNSHLNKYDILL